LQYELDEGPCLSAWSHRAPFRVDDLPDPRWPEWSTAVGPLFIRSTLSVPLLAGDTAFGAMKVYSEQPEVFTDREEQILTRFAAQAAIPLANMQSLEKAQQLSSGLREALNHRQVIGQAMGIIMAPGGIDETAAFAQLVGTSQRQNKKLRDVAQDLVRSTVRRRR
jgi:GAF domain-containing protein